MVRQAGINTARALQKHVPLSKRAPYVPNSSKPSRALHAFGPTERRIRVPATLVTTAADVSAFAGAQTISGISRVKT